MGCLKLARDEKNETVLRCTWNREKESKPRVNIYYYGARYYDPRTAIWQSVDKLAENYPRVSPYAYVANNPIIAVDPDGKKIINKAAPNTKSFDLIEHSRLILAKTNPRLYKLLEESPAKINISMGKINKDDAYKEGYIGIFLLGVTKTSYISKNGVDVKDGNLVMFTSQEERKAKYDNGEKIDYKKNVSFDDAERFVEIDGDIDILIDDTMLGKSKRDFATVVAHEFGHAGFNLFNKAKSFYWSIVSGGKSHAPGNPDGEYANKIGNEINENYKNAKKSIKDDEKE